MDLFTQIYSRNVYQCTFFERDERCGAHTLFQRIVKSIGDVTMYDQRISGKVPLDEDLSNTKVDTEALELLADFDNYVRQKNNHAFISASLSSV